MGVLHFVEGLATPISAYSTVILVLVTAYYAYKTSKILDESRKARQAAERQAAAAEASIRLLREQIEERAGLDKTIVASAMQTAIRNIEYWQGANVYSLAAIHAIPQNVQLLPGNANSAVEHSRRISVEGSGELSSALDYLRYAENEIQILRDAKQTDHHFLEQHTRAVSRYLELARQDLRRAEGWFSKAVAVD
jgi:hypothetical protein